MPASSLRRPRRARGYLLPEAIASVALLGVGLLPLAGMVAAAPGWVRGYSALTQACRAAVEALELGDAVAAPVCVPGDDSMHGPTRP